MTENQKRRRLRPLLSGVVLRSQTDERLAALASTGNQQAFSTIYERYRRELGSHACRIVRPDRADDVVQHAMLAAWNALLAGAEISDLRAWLHRVTRNAALDTINRRGYDDGEIPPSSTASTRTDELAEGRLSATAALAALAALPDSQRRALTLIAIEGRSGHDAALEMGISESAMRQTVYRARSSMRSAVTALTPLPLINWLVTAAGAPDAPAALSLGAAGGAVATVAKVAAVIGVTAATLGTTHAFQTHHRSSHARNVPTGHVASVTAARVGPQGGLRVSQASVSAPPAAATNDAVAQLSGEPRPDPSQTGPSQQGPGSTTNHQSGSDGATGGGGNRQSGPTRAKAGVGQHDVAAQSGADNGSQPQQSSRANSATPSGEPTASPSPAPQTGQALNGNE
jgi:RNA polymerase sigma factor (sigma-70 family)